MATRVNKDPEPYEKIENIVMNKIYELETENAQLKQDLIVAKAKLEVYERLANISGTKSQLRFWTTNQTRGGLNNDHFK